MLTSSSRIPALSSHSIPLCPLALVPTFDEWIQDSECIVVGKWSNQSKSIRVRGTTRLRSERGSFSVCNVVVTSYCSESESEMCSLCAWFVIASEHHFTPSVQFANQSCRNIVGWISEACYSSLPLFCCSSLQIKRSLPKDTANRATVCTRRTRGKCQPFSKATFKGWPLAKCTGRIRFQPIAYTHESWWFLYSDSTLVYIDGLVLWYRLVQLCSTGL